jgi:hypothetical protein
MTPKEKATEIVDKFLPYADKKARVSCITPIMQDSSRVMEAALSNQSGITYSVKDLVESAKKCALIAVDDAILYHPFPLDPDEIDVRFNNFWNEVKTEIKKLN